MCYRKEDVLAGMIRIEGLSDIDVLELEEDLPPGSLREEPTERASGGDHADFGVISAVVLISVASINALSLWLARRHTKETAEIELSIDVRPDQSWTLHCRQSGDRETIEPPSAETVAAFRTKLTELLSPPLGQTPEV
jgi:hypothetical protein